MRSGRTDRSFYAVVAGLVGLVAALGPGIALRAARSSEPPDVRIRLWCDQTGAVPIEDLTFGVRYIYEGRQRVDIEVTPSGWWWHTFTRMYRNGVLLAPRGDGLGPGGVRPRSDMFTLQPGQSREYTFTLAEAIELDQISPGVYLIFVQFGTERVNTHAVELRVWREKDETGRERMFGRVEAQGVRRPDRPATQPTTQPAE